MCCAAGRGSQRQWRRRVGQSAARGSSVPPLASWSASTHCEALRRANEARQRPGASLLRCRCVCWILRADREVCRQPLSADQQPAAGPALGAPASPPMRPPLAACVGAADAACLCCQHVTAGIDICSTCILCIVRL